MTIPIPAIPSPRMVALAWLANVLPDLQAGKGMLTPFESWAGQIYATVSDVTHDSDPYVPIRDAHVQIDIWGRPNPEMQRSGLPINQCDSIVEYIEQLTIHFSPLQISFPGGQYLDAHLGDAYTVSGSKAGAAPEKPTGATVALSRARLTVCFVYKIPDV